MNRIINLTGKPVVMVDHHHKVTAVFPVSGIQLWQDQDVHDVEAINGEGKPATYMQVTMSPMRGLPKPSEDTKYIVTARIASAARKASRSTDDMLITEAEVRSPDGEHIGWGQLLEL